MAKYIFVFNSPGAILTHTANFEMYEELTQHLNNNEVFKTNFRYPDEMIDNKLCVYTFDPFDIKRCTLRFTIDNINNTKARDIEEIISDADNHFTPTDSLIILRSQTPIAYTMNTRTLRNIIMDLREDGYDVERI